MRLCQPLGDGTGELKVITGSAIGERDNPVGSYPSRRQAHSMRDSLPNFFLHICLSIKEKR